MSEHDEQAALFEYAEWRGNQDARWKLLYAVPNGGHRHIVVAKRMKAEGVKAGVPDVCLPVPCGGYHGLYVELKIAGNTTTEAQDWWLARLSEQGYATAVAYGFEEAKRIIEGYLRGGGK